MVPTLTLPSVHIWAPSRVAGDIATVGVSEVKIGDPIQGAVIQSLS